MTNREEQIQRQMEAGREMRKTVVDLRLSGMSFLDISKKVNLPESSIRNIIKDTMEDGRTVKKLVVQLRLSGMSIKDVSEKVNLPESSVRNLLKNSIKNL